MRKTSSSSVCFTCREENGYYRIVNGIAIWIIAGLLALRLLFYHPEGCVVHSEEHEELQTAVTAKTHPPNPPIFGHNDRVVPKEGIPAVLITSSTTPPFHIFAFHPSVDNYITKHLLHNGAYEPDLTAFIQKLFPIGENKYTALDLGANVGFHALHMASRGANVITFEASPDTAWLLRSSAALNGLLVDRPPLSSNKEKGVGGSLTLIEKGVSDENTVGRMFRFPNSPGMTSFSTSESFDLQKGKDGSALDRDDIPLVRAQDVLEELGVFPNDKSVLRLRLLKMDVEGFELKALKGLDLQKYQFEYLTFEFFPHLLENANTNPSDLLAYIWSCGYRYFYFDDSRQSMMDGDDEKWDERFILTTTGSSNEKEVRAWADKMVQKGYKDRGDNFHTNLFAKLVEK